MTELLLKGFEIELFTGLESGVHVGVSEEVSKVFSDFVKEPDQRNLEYVTSPDSQYENLTEALLAPRRRLREWLKQKNLTILPGSALTFGTSDHFERSDLDSFYHNFIELNYGTKVVTASVHINLGIDDLINLFAALRLVRCEASIFLALSASSPFLDRRLTGAHSQRWIQFPRTPKDVPLFISHCDYVSWVERQLDEGIMINERHLWTSVRPNGPDRPYKLNRLELRICDLITNCDLLLAVTALLELRVLSVIRSPNKFDPLQASKLDLKSLSKLCDKNEEKVAENSLDASLKNWVDGKDIVCRDWIAQILEDVKPLAIEMNIIDRLFPIEEVLRNGNQSMKWIDSFLEEKSLSLLFKETISEMVEEELCSSNTSARLSE